MRRLFLLLAVFACFSGFLSSAAFSAERRIALVIGNADYETIGDLANPVHDSRLVRQTLEQLNFEVVYRENVNRDAMLRALSVFTEKVEQAGTSGVALVYYAGHGVQSSGENFLLPVDIQVERESDLRLNAIRASDLLAQMESAASGIKIVILDACRDNPFKSRLGNTRVQGGLADIGLGGSEFFVAFAATAGNTADDGNAANSPYAQALARRLPTVDSEISNTFRLVRIDVSAATGNKQLPETRTTMRREFYFLGDRKTAQDDMPKMTQAPNVDLVAAKPQDLVGAWCEAGRGAGIKMNFEPATLSFVIGGQKLRYAIESVTSLSDGKLQVLWRDRNGAVTFEFGDFDSLRSKMTQIRGKRGAAGDWKDYNVRYKRCG